MPIIGKTKCFDTENNYVIDYDNTEDLKKIADYVTDTVDNNGFVKAIEKFVLKEGTNGKIRDTEDSKGADWLSRGFTRNPSVYQNLDVWLPMENEAGKPF